MDDHHEGTELRELLGKTRFLEFAREYLIAHGESPEDAGEIINETEAREVARQEKWQAGVRLQKKKDEWLKEHVFKGVETVSSPKCFGDDEEEDQGFWFSSENFAEILRRCELHGIAVTFMIHDSLDGEADRQEMSPHISAPLELLRRWQEEGCKGKFSGAYKVPDKLLE